MLAGFVTLCRHTASRAHRLRQCPPGRVTVHWIRLEWCLARRRLGKPLSSAPVQSRQNRCDISSLSFPTRSRQPGSNLENAAKQRWGQALSSIRPPCGPSRPGGRCPHVLCLTGCRTDTNKAHSSWKRDCLPGTHRFDGKPQWFHGQLRNFNPRPRAVGAESTGFSFLLKKLLNTLNR